MISLILSHSSFIIILSWHIQSCVTYLVDVTVLIKQTKHICGFLNLIQVASPLMQLPRDLASQTREFSENGW